MFGMKFLTDRQPYLVNLFFVEVSLNYLDRLVLGLLKLFSQFFKLSSERFGAFCLLLLLLLKECQLFA